MCNAHNHRAGCTCGWGGGESSSSSISTSLYVSRMRALQNNAAWSGISTAIESYTRPNANCPVCGAAVYFYRSPYGGSVYFDELGIPWPKHPCMDFGSSTRRPAYSGSSFSQNAAKVATWEIQGWIPVVILKSDLFDVAVIIRLFSPQTKKFYYIGSAKTIGINPGSPAFIKFVSDSDDELDFGFLNSNERYSAVSPQVIRCYDNCFTEKHYNGWISALSGNAGAQNAIGWRASFSNDTLDLRKISHFPENCNWTVALKWFQRSADQGYWAAQNNLGVMYLHGYGVKKDEKRAFNFFLSASDSAAPITLRHLAECYANGIGTVVDLILSERLYSQADALDEELKGSG